MFINFSLKSNDEFFAATVNVANIILIELAKSSVELCDGDKDVYYRIDLRLHEAYDLTLFETDDLEKLQLVHSSLCSVISGNQTAIIDDVGFIEQVVPTAAFEETGDQFVELDESKPRTLSDK